MLDTWPSRGLHRTPQTSYPLPQAENRGPTTVYPSRIDIYRDSTRATMHNSWRLARAIILDMIAQTARFLAASNAVSVDDARELTNFSHETETGIRSLIDDFCASIPYIISPDNSEKLYLHYPHAPGDAPFAHIPEINLIAGMSQLMPSLVVSLRFSCIPDSQKQWIQQYTTMLTRNPPKDTKVPEVPVDR